MELLWGSYDTHQARSGSLYVDSLALRHRLCRRSGLPTREADTRLLQEKKHSTEWLMPCHQQEAGLRTRGLAGAGDCAAGSGEEGERRGQRASERWGVGGCGGTHRRAWQCAEGRGGTVGGSRGEA